MPTTFLAHRSFMEVQSAATFTKWLLSKWGLSWGPTKCSILRRCAFHLGFNSCSLWLEATVGVYFFFPFIQCCWDKLSLQPYMMWLITRDYVELWLNCDWSHYDIDHWRQGSHLHHLVSSLTSHIAYCIKPQFPISITAEHCDMIENLNMCYYNVLTALLHMITHD